MRPRPWVQLFLLILLPALLAGCGTASRMLSWKPFKRQAKQGEAPKTQQDLYLGVIEMVNPEQKFVLVRADTRMTFQPGTRLQTRPLTGARAELVLTPERKMTFISADIKEGFPQAGDVVVIPYTEPAATASLGAATPAAVAAIQPVTASGAQPRLLGDPLPEPSQAPPGNEAGSPVPVPGTVPAPGGESLPPPIR